MRSYLTILKIPGALSFCAAGLLARSGGAMMSIGAVLMVSALYGSYGLAGGLAAANSIAWAIGTALLSRLVDRRGQRKVMLPAALTSAAALAAMVILALFHAPIWVLFICTVISGATGGSVGALVRARWSHLLTSPAQLHTAFSLESTLDEITYAVGPVLATWLATTVHPAAGLACPVVLSVVGALVFYSLRSTEPPIIPKESTAPKHDKLILLYPGFASIIGVGLLMGCLFGGIDVTAVAAATSWGQRSKSGIVLALMSVGSASAGILYGSRGWKSPLWRRFVIGTVLLGACSTLLLASSNTLTLSLFGFLSGLSVAPTFINANGLIGRLVPATRLTEGLAWLGTSVGIGASIGSTAAGAAIDSFSWLAGFVCVAISGVLALVIGLSSIGILRRVAADETPVEVPEPAPE